MTAFVGVPGGAALFGIFVPTRVFTTVAARTTRSAARTVRTNANIRKTF
jgi:hypothetical protein